MNKNLPKDQIPLMQHSPTECSRMVEMFSVYALQYGSHIVAVEHLKSG